MITEEEIEKRLLMTRDAMETHSRKRAGDLATAARMVVETYRAGGKVLIFGNGGSAAEAQHIAAELVNRMKLDREPLAAVALTTDGSIMTSIANDYEFKEVFAKQVRGLGRPGDLAWGLSTSGASPNVIRALQAAGKIGMKRMAMAGRPGTKIAEAAELCLWVDADSTPVVQEVHLAAAHIICELVERELFGGGNG
ncbi:MAG TPA: SIS domain-containing protein [bacterium]|nr:SIS domain-containing protein [bacterium]